MAVMDIRPSDILYSQDSISKYFDRKSFHGSQTIGHTLDQIITGKCSISNIPKISVVKLTHRRNYFSVDNRRLWVFKQLERLGYLDTIEVNHTTFNPYFHGRKITTKNGGISIRIRGDGNPEGAAHTLPDNWYTALKEKAKKDRKSDIKEQKKTYASVEANNPVSCSRKQPIATSAHEQRKPAQRNASTVRSIFSLQSYSSQNDTFPTSETRLHNENTTHPTRSSGTYANRGLDSSYGEDLRTRDREIREYSARFQKLSVADPVKVSSHGSDSSNMMDRSLKRYDSQPSQYSSYAKYDDTPIPYKDKTYESKMPYASSESKTKTMSLASSHVRYKETNRDEYRYVVSPDKGPEPLLVEEQHLHFNQEKGVVSKRIGSDSLRIKPTQATRVNPSTATYQTGLSTAGVGRSLSRNSELEVGFTSSMSALNRYHTQTRHPSYCTEEDVEKSMNLLLHRQRYKALHPDSWSTICYKSGY